MTHEATAGRRRQEATTERPHDIPRVWTPKLDDTGDNTHEAAMIASSLLSRVRPPHLHAWNGATSCRARRDGPQ